MILSLGTDGTWANREAVFVDETHALNVDMTPAVATVSAAMGEERPEAGKTVVSASHNRRLMMECPQLNQQQARFPEVQADSEESHRVH